MIKKIIGILLLAIGISSACAQALPPGNYMESCGDFSWDSTEFIGNCLMGQVDEYGAVLVNGSGVDNANLCTYIQNINGVLTCTGGYKFNGGLCTYIANINGELKCGN